VYTSSQALQTVVCLHYALSCLSVGNVGLLWPNGWMDQDKACHAGRPRLWPHCVRWRPNSPCANGDSPQFSVHVCCCQMAGCIKMPLGGYRGRLGPGDFVLDGDPVPSIKRGRSAPQFLGPCLLWPKGWTDQDGTWHGGGTQLPLP